MKSEKGITLTALVVYIGVATIIIATIAVISSFFFSNMDLIKDQDKYAVEFNKFNMFFIADVKDNKSAAIEGAKIVFEDGTTYQYIAAEKAIYRNETKIAKEIQTANFTLDTYKVSNTTKNLININLTIGKKENFKKEIQYVMKYY